MSMIETATDDESRINWEMAGEAADPRLGQHFLTDAAVAGVIADWVNREQPSTVVEIGAGLGTLSTEICRRNVALIAVEVDPRLVPTLKARLAEFGDLADVRQGDYIAIASELHLSAGATAVSILPFAHDLSRALLARTVVQRDIESVFFVYPDEFVARIVPHQFISTRLCDIDATRFRPRHGGPLGLYRWRRDANVIP